MSGKLPVEHRARAGKALCVWGDAGWGALVREGKHTAGRFDDALVDACVDLIRGWSPQPAPTWVTCVPSLRRPVLVSDFARRLASALSLPFDPVLIRTEPRPEQRAMANSTQQARNVDGSLALARARPSAGPVLLVDGIIDSGWTITVAAWLLRRAGSGDVWPLALAKTGGGE